MKLFIDLTVTQIILFTRRLAFVIYAVLTLALAEYVALTDNLSGGTGALVVRVGNNILFFQLPRLVLLSSHITEDIAQTCSRLAVLDHGQLHFHGSIQMLLQTTAGRVWEFMTADHSVQERQDLRVVAITHTEQGTHYRVLAEE